MFFDQVFFFFLGCAAWLVGPQFSTQGWNLGPGGERQPARGQARTPGAAKGWEQLWEAGSAQAVPH